jgi:hypothetical protein
MTVAGRLKMAHDFEKELTIESAIVEDTDQHVLFKSVVTTKKGQFTGYSEAWKSGSQDIETQNPYEVAETSAVGRALGFAGFGLASGVASADEVKKAEERMSEAQWQKILQILKEERVPGAEQEALRLLGVQVKEDATRRTASSLIAAMFRKQRAKEQSRGEQPTGSAESGAVEEAAKADPVPAYRA